MRRGKRPRSTSRSVDAVAWLAGAGLVGPSRGALRGGPSTSAPDGGLAGGTDGLVVPIALVVVAGLLVGGLLLVTIARRRTRAAAASEAAASDETLPGAAGRGSGRDPNLPRWLDPSVTAARFRPDTTTAVRAVAMATAPPRLPLVFGTPVDGLAERRRVRYDGVPLLDRPDDVLGRTQGELDGGDEVELMERGEIWSQVRTPSGATGWLPSMTLSGPGPQIADDGDDADDPPRRPILPEPPPPASDTPSLEALFAAVAAQRLSRREPADGVLDGAVERVAAPPAPPDAPVPEAAGPDPHDPPAPARPGPRKPTSARRAAKPAVPGKPTDELDPEPATGPGPASPAPKRSRARTPRGDRPAARHR